VSWLEVSVTTSGELAEAVADILARLALGGVALEATQLDPQAEESGLTDRVRVCAYLPTDPDPTDARRQIEESLWHLGQIVPLPAPQFHLIDDADWATAWRAHYHPLPIGQRLLIQPAWLVVEQTARLPILLDPGMAFGTGTHPSTQLTLEALESICRRGMRVVDLGCGSGILSIAAAKLGAGSVLALDIDPLAVRIAQENCERNGVDQQIEVVEGSLAELQRRLEEGEALPDLLLANILSSVISSLLQQGLGNALAPVGRMVLAGILDHQAEALAAEARSLGLELTEIRAQLDWRALVIRKTAARKSGGGR
jgi:ribosomal protein L11 methyltransferase